MSSKAEIIRRLRLGNLRSVLCARCGHTLPDDEAGREYLWELLLTVSLGAEAGRKMENIISISAPWMKMKEATEMTDQINRLRRYLRTVTPREIGQRLRVTREEWIRLKLKTVLPFDMTDEEITEFRKARKRNRDRNRRRKAGKKPREVYIANSLSKKKPWATEDISRRTWERRRRKPTVASLPPIKLLSSERHTCDTENPERPKELARSTEGKTKTLNHNRRRRRGSNGTGLARP
jgi:hypothetical protein